MGTMRKPGESYNAVITMLVESRAIYAATVYCILDRGVQKIPL